MGKSIFELADKFGYDSPWEEKWVEEKIKVGFIENRNQNVSNQNSTKLKPNTSTKPKIPAYGKVGDFTEKSVYKDGVGNYHVNHFIGYFDYKNITAPSKELIKEFNRLFFNNFVTIFSPNNVAIATVGKTKYKNKSTVKFEINGNSKPKSIIEFLTSPIEDIKYFSGIIHPDWVSFELYNEFSFFGSTLKRNWAESYEVDLFKNITSIVKEFNLVTEENAIKFVMNLIEVNQHHFLAGRRSWAVGFDDSLKMFFVETMAFERSSQCEYNVVEKTGKLRETIIELWTRLIFNFFEYFSLTASSFVDNNKLSLITTDDYKLNGNFIMYKTEEEKLASKILSKQWVKKAIVRHPGLMKDL